MALALSLAACGHGKAEANKTPDQLADQIGCINYTPNEDEVMFAKASGLCSLNGADISIETFATTKERDNFLAAAQAFGGIYGVGSYWIVEGDDAGVKAATSALGGSIA